MVGTRSRPSSAPQAAVRNERRPKTDLRRLNTISADGRSTASAAMTSSDSSSGGSAVPPPEESRPTAAAAAISNTDSSTVHGDSADGGADADKEITMTMAELELRRYVAETASAYGSSTTSTSTSPSAATSPPSEGRKRRRTRSSQLTGVDYHRVRTGRMHRFEEMFWDGDAGYGDDSDCSEEEEEGEEGGEEEGDADRDGGDAEADEAGEGNGEGNGDGKDTAADAPPSGDTNDNGNTKEPQIHLNYGRRLHLQKVHDSPHIYVIDNFLTEGELKHIDNKIMNAEKNELFERSFLDKGDGGRRRRSSKKKKKSRKVGEDGDDAEEEDEEQEEKKNDDDNDSNTVNSRRRRSSNSRQGTDVKQRTSTFIHFGKMADSKIATIESRAADLLQLPHICVEPLQLVRYGPGQYFREHHDMGVLFEDGSVELPPRVMAGVPRRVVTILVYLNDIPAGAGGGTRFPYLSPSGHGERTEDEDDGLVVHPVRGRAVVWCNIDQTGMPDPRTVHEGMPLIKAEGRVRTRPVKKKVKKEKVKKVKKEKKKRVRKKKKKKKPTPRPRPPVDQVIRSIIIPRSDRQNPTSSFGMNFRNVLPDNRTVLSNDYSHPHTVQRLGLQLGRLKENDVVVSVNGTAVFDVETERVLMSFRDVIGLMKSTRPGRSIKLDVLRYAPKLTDQSSSAGATECDDPVTANDLARPTPDATADDVGSADPSVKEAAAAGGSADADFREDVSDVVMKGAANDANVKQEADEGGGGPQIKEDPTEEKVEEETSKDQKDPEVSEEETKVIPLRKYALNIWAVEE